MTVSSMFSVVFIWKTISIVWLYVKSPDLNKVDRPLHSLPAVAGDPRFQKLVTSPAHQISDTRILDSRCWNSALDVRRLAFAAVFRCGALALAQAERITAFFCAFNLPIVRPDAVSRGRSDYRGRLQDHRR